MRRVLFILALGLAACSGDDDAVTTTPEPVQHVPEMSSLKLYPDSALYMEGGGSLLVTAEVSYTDLGQDIETLHVKGSDGISMTVSVAEMIDSISGTLSTALAMRTSYEDGYTVEIWLVDRAGQSSNVMTADFSVTKHVPEITNVNLSPDSALYMEGDGSVVVTAEIGFSDVGGDIETLWVQLPDGTITDFDLDIAEQTGSFAQDFTISTQRVGELAVEFWLVDKALEESALRVANFTFVFDSQSSDCTSRLKVPQELYDVVWDGQAFIVVGQGGAILTSPDGVEWEAQESGVGSNLYAIAADGGDVFAVGGRYVLMSTDHGKTWSAKGESDHPGLNAVAVSASRVVATGLGFFPFPKVVISEDRGDTWQMYDLVKWPTDLVYQGEMFLAVTGSSVLVSSNGEQWNETLVHEWATSGWLWFAVHDGDRFFVGGDAGTVYSSLDAINWTRLLTPIADVDYRSAAWDGSRLLLAGGVHDDWDQGIYHPFGLSSTNAGATWETFHIEPNYRSNSMAWGNGRFVSVGETLDTDGGAIYTTE
jgi:hypothetical protein